jgi:hypothetical protein
MRLLDEQYTRTPFYGVRKMVWWLDEQGYLEQSVIFPAPSVNSKRSSSPDTAPVNRQSKYHSNNSVKEKHKGEIQMKEFGMITVGVAIAIASLMPATSYAQPPQRPDQEINYHSRFPFTQRMAEAVGRRFQPYLWQASYMRFNFSSVKGGFLFFAYSVAAFRVFKQVRRVSGDPFIVEAPFEERFRASPVTQRSRRPNGP